MTVLYVSSMNDDGTLAPSQIRHFDFDHGGVGVGIAVLVLVWLFSIVSAEVGDTVCTCTAAVTKEGRQRHQYGG